MKTKKFITLFALLLTTGALSAQQPVSRSNSCGGVNLSIWKGVATQRADTVSSTWLNLGLVSYMNRLNGLSVNVLASATRTNATGLQLSGIANVTGGSMQGIQIAGITNVNGENLRGISLSGLVNINGDKAQGLMASGLVTISGEKMQGVSIGGLLNISGEKSRGLQIGGMANIAGQKSSGISLGGLLNVAGESMNGLQLAGLLNITGENMRGLQLAGLGNVCGSNMQGLQIAPFNAAKRISGAQIGIINYRMDSLSRGVQLGLVNLTPYTRYQLMLGVGNNSTFDAGARFKNRHWYTILGLGTGYHHMGSKFNASFFYRAGVEYPIKGRFSLSGDLGYRHIEGFSNKHHGHPKSLYALQGRLQLHYRLTEKHTLFAGTGYSQTRRYDSGHAFDKNALIEAGVLLF